MPTGPVATHLPVPGGEARHHEFTRRAILITVAVTGLAPLARFGEAIRQAIARRRRPLPCRCTAVRRSSSRCQDPGAGHLPRPRRGPRRLPAGGMSSRSSSGRALRRTWPSRLIPRRRGDARSRRRRPCRRAGDAGPRVALAVGGVGTATAPKRGTRPVTEHRLQGRVTSRPDGHSLQCRTRSPSQRGHVGVGGVPPLVGSVVDRVLGGPGGFLAAARADGHGRVPPGVKLVAHLVAPHDELGVGGTARRDRWPRPHGATAAATIRSRVLKTAAIHNLGQPAQGHERSRFIEGRKA
jgi:hypothetical protein